MLFGPKNQFSLTRAALSTSGRAKSKFLLVFLLVAEVSVTMQEILRLLKADSGKDFSPDKIAIRPTSRACSMNGGVFVDVGEGARAGNGLLPEYSMVFGPDGSLVCYLKGIDPKPTLGRSR